MARLVGCQEAIEASLHTLSWQFVTGMPLLLAAPLRGTPSLMCLKALAVYRCLVPWKVALQRDHAPLCRTDERFLSHIMVAQVSYRS